MKMTRDELNRILDAHKKWFNGEEGGICANLHGAYLGCANLSDTDLHGANLHGAYLGCANLSNTDLHGADLSGANLSGADLHDTDMRYTNLSSAYLHGADLSGANLSGADISSGADLSNADLSGANLSGADLKGTNLSGAKGVLSAIDYMQSSFERTNDGYIVYKIFSGQYASPEDWEIRPGSVLTENVNFDRTAECGCGINVAPLEWVRKHYDGEIWRCLIRWEWLPGVCVPYNTNGKIRCERVELLEVVK